MNPANRLSLQKLRAALSENIQFKEEPLSSDDDTPLAVKLSRIKSRVKKENNKIPAYKEYVSVAKLRKNFKNSGHEIDEKLSALLDEEDWTPYSLKNRKKRACPLCGEEFVGLLRHLNRHATRTAYKCDTCAKSFTYKGKLTDHKKFAHGINYACEVCNKTFKHRDNIRIHMTTHQTEGKFVCYLCGYLTKRRQCLQVHMMRHEDKYLCRCKVCNRGFYSYATLDQHMNKHTGEKPFTCDQCGLNYSNYNTLWKHSTKYHTEKFQNIFPCKLCKKVFMKEKSFKIHMADIHSKGSHFECDLCTKTFNAEASLNIHKRTHTNFRPHRCEVCGGAFTARKYLTKHMAVHRSKNYKCRFCYKKFMIETALNNHERRHEEVR